MAGDPADAKYRSQLIDTLIAGAVIYPDNIEVYYKYQKELPSLPNPLRIKEEGSSHGKNLVGKCQLSANLEVRIGKGWFSITYPIAA